MEEKADTADFLDQTTRKRRQLSCLRVVLFASIDIDLFPDVKLKQESMEGGEGVGEKDIAEKKLLAYADVFANILNVGLFGGDEVIHSEELTDVSPQSTYKVKGKLREQERDVAKLWKDSELRLALFGIENQSSVDKTMPLRVIGYDGAAYRDELNAKPVKIYPVVTVVLYFGWKRHWNKPRRLKECFGQVSERLEPYINDYCIHVIEVAWLPDEIIAKFANPFRMVAEYFSQMRKKEEYCPSEEYVRHAREVLDLLSLLTKDVRFKEAKETVKEGELRTMRSLFLDQAEEKGRAKGMAEGEARGEAKEKHETILRLFRKGRALDVISDATGWTVEQIQTFLKSQHLQPAQ